MTIDFVDLKRQDKIYKKELMQSLEEVVDNASFIMGPEVEQFEEEFAKFCNKKFCVSLNSGTDALEFALVAHGIKPGDEVITAPNSYFSSAMIITKIGATAVFAEVDQKTYTITAKNIEKKLTKKTKAIIPVHLYGQATDMDPIIKLAKENNLVIVEDCCQAHGTLYKGKRLPYTTTGAYSFYPGKNLGAFGDAGAIVTDDEKIKDLLELLRNDGSRVKYEHKIMGYKSRLDTIQAAILNVKLPHLEMFVTKRKDAAKKYKTLLSDVKNIVLPYEAEHGTHAYHIFAIQCEKRDKLREFLKNSGVTTVIHYPKPIHLQEPYLKMGFKKGDFPITEELAERTLSIPIFPEILDEEIEFISAKIHEFYS